MSNATAREAILPSTFAISMDARMEVKSFTAWNAERKMINILLTRPLK
jgi:hypothetical protein